MRVWLLSLVLLISGAARALNIPAPEMQLHTFEGDRLVDLKQYRGKVVYLDFWASYCAICPYTFNAMNTMQQDFRAQGLEVVAVSMDSDKTQADFFLQKNPARFTVLHDPEQEMRVRFALQAMPSSFLIDRKGRIRHIQRGFKEGDEVQLRKVVEELLLEK